MRRRIGYEQPFADARPRGHRLWTPARVRSPVDSVGAHLSRLAPILQQARRGDCGTRFDGGGVVRVGALGGDWLVGVWFRGSVAACAARFRAAAIVAGGRRVCSGVIAGGARGQPVAAGSVLSLSNAALSAWVQAGCRGGAASLGVRRTRVGSPTSKAVAQSFRFGFGELAVEDLSPDDQVVREDHDLDPHLVCANALNAAWTAGVLVVTDAVRDPRALALTTLDDRDVWVVSSVRIAWKRYPSWSVNGSWAPGRGRSRRTITLDPAGQERRSRWSVISQTSPFSRR